MNADKSFLDAQETPIDQLSYEEAFNQLDAIVAALDGNELPLEAAMDLFERGQDLIRRCAELLDKADLRVRQLSGDNLLDFEP
jgi:exodeoxyribonuclease VII small subunit